LEILFTIVDWLVALSIPFALFFLYLKQRILPSVLMLAAAGFFIGLTWELAFYFMGPHMSSDPVYTQFHDISGHPLLQTFLHSLWDMGLFMIGYYLVLKCLKAPYFSYFSYTEWGVMVAWGQFQELCVEMLATGFGMWTFNPGPWNLVLFPFGSGVITLMPQLVWLVGSTVFYFMILFIHRRIRLFL